LISPALEMETRKFYRDLKKTKKSYLWLDEIVRNSNFALETRTNSKFARHAKWGQSPKYR